MRRSMPTTRLRDETFRLLHVKLATTMLKDICAETGLPRTFLIRFHQGVAREPSVNRIEALYEYLSGRQIEF